MTTTFTRPQTEPSAEVAYGRRLLAAAAVLIRDGVGVAVPDGLTTHEAIKARAEIAGWLDFYGDILKDGFSSPKLPVRRDPARIDRVRRLRVAAAIADASDPNTSTARRNSK